jgi:hypothetical protein
MTDQEEFVLMPVRHDEQSKCVRISIDSWTAAINLCRSHGYTNTCWGGVNTDEARWLVKALRNALLLLQEGCLRTDIEKVVEFIETEGRRGFTLQRRWKRSM